MSTISAYTGDGSTKQFDITFTYAGAATVFVRVDGVDQSYTFVNPSRVELSTAPASGSLVEVYRKTSVALPAVDFEDGAIVLADDLDEAVGQPRQRVEELESEVAAVRQHAIFMPGAEVGFTFPTAAARAGKYLAFDGTGNPAMATGTDSDGLAEGIVTALQDRLQVATSSALTAVVASVAGTVAFVSDPLTGGHFVLRSGAIPAGDPLHGLYVPGAAGLYWERLWDGVTGFAEWLGAVADDPSHASQNVAAINAAITLFPTTQLRAGNYWVDDTIIVDTAQRRLFGAGFSAFNSADGITGLTRITSTSATATGLQIGPTARPPGYPNSLPQGIRVSDLFIDRSVAPSIASNCIGVLVNYVLAATVERIKSRNSMIGFRFGGCVGTTVDRTYSVRDIAGAGGGSDGWTGYDHDGNYDVGTVGGNASLFVIKPNAACNIAALQTSANCIGYRIYGNAQDQFWHDPESNTCGIGLWVEGGLANGDISIIHPVMDATAITGILLQNTTLNGAINITDPYVAPVAGSGGSAISFDNSHAVITVTGGQVLMGTSHAVALSMVNTNLATIIGTGIQANINANVVSLTNLTSCRVEPTIANNSGADSTFNAIAVFGALTACVIRPLVHGTNKFAKGITVVGSGDARSTYDIGGINSDSLTGGYQTKLVRNGVNVPTSPTMLPMYSGTNLVTGCAG